MDFLRLVEALIFVIEAALGAIALFAIVWFTYLLMEF